MQRGIPHVKLSPGPLLFAQSLVSQHGFWESIMGQSAAYMASLRRQARKCSGTPNNRIAPNECTTLHPCTVTLCRENAPRSCFLLTFRKGPIQRPEASERELSAMFFSGSIWIWSVRGPYLAHESIELLWVPH